MVIGFPIDKKWIGVKFSEPVGSTSATQSTNYTLSQGTVVQARGSHEWH